MSITDELRKEAQGHLWYLYTSEQAKHLLAIADRIDAEHHAAIRRWQQEIDALRDELREAVRLSEDKASDMVELPKDADGEYIHIGDTVEWVPYDNTYPSVVREVDAVGNGVFFAWDKANGRFAQYEAYAYRHHKQPTVEGVLMEFGIDWEHEDNCEDRAALLRGYAVKLRLAGDDE